MRTKTNRTLRKIFSIALCLVLVMSYVPMVSITAGAADDYAVVDTEAGTVTIDGTLGGKTTATKDEVNALVEQLKAYVDNGITTIIVPGTEHAMYESALGTIPAYAEALYLLTDLNKDIPYCGTIDLILPDATEIIDFSFDSVDALKSITLPKVTTVGDGAFYGCRYLEKMTFGSVITEVVEIKSGVFVSLGIKSDNEACDLVLNCEQLNAEDKYKPNLESNVWYIGEWSGETEWKSITFGTHVSGEDGTCDCGAGVVAEVEYGDTATYYATLADALAVAQYRSGANVYALTDCNDDFTIPASVSFYGGDNSFGGNVTNKGYIREGTFNGEVSNNGDIRGGTFNGEVTNEDFILVGTFNGTVINHEIIDGGTFNGNVTNYDRIYNHFDDDRFTLGDDFTIENHGTISCDYHHWKDGVCRLCAYACTHADGTDATCTSGPICSDCGHEYGEALGHTIVEDSYADNSNGTHSFTCSVCGNVTEEHSGGTATCTTQAVCEACGASYGDVDLTKHDEYINGFCLTCDAYQPAVLNADGYYEIGNVGNLFWLAEQVNYSSLTKFNAVLTSDLIIPDSKQWMPINLPDGIQNASVFDGNGHSITLNQSSGLFSSFNYSVFRNVILYGTVTANTTGNIGAVVGSAYRTTIQNVISYVDVTNSNGNAGGLAGYFGGKHSDEMYSKIENCAVYADISGTNTGGLIGEGWNGTQYFDIANCTYVGDITGTNAGAIVGYQNTDSNTCVFTNIYWCEADGIGFYGKRDTSNQVYTNTMAKTPEQFASGEVAYLLQQGNTEQVWGQDNNQAGATPIFDATGLYKVVTVGETGNYSVANVGDTNGDGTVDVTDYQALVNMAVSEGHSQTETASYDDIIRYDLDGDGYLDVIDAYLLHLFINGFTTVDVYAVGDYDLNGMAFEEADIKAIKHAIENPEKLATYKKYASDINGDGKLDENDLTALTAKYGEVTGTECADNVKVYYRWGNKYSTCTATSMCTLCGKKVATETVNTTSETLSELTCTQDGKVKYTATFQNELLGTKSTEIVSKAEGHKYNDDGECICGAKLSIVDLASQTEGETVNITGDCRIIGDGNEYNISLNIAEDATVIFEVGTSGVKLNAPITVADGKTLTLLVKGDAEHTVNGGISLGNASNVVIEGDLDKPNNKLTVTGTNGNSGIGANGGVTAGDITIRNARVDATGSSKEVSADSNMIIRADTSISGAAIGTSDGSMGDILIENSIIVAEGGYYENTSHAPAIGIGYVGSTMGNITLKDSQITAANNGDGLASVIGAGANHHVFVSGSLGDIVITNTELNLSMAVSTKNWYAAVIGSGIGFSHGYVNMGKIIFTDVTQAELDEMIPTWLPSDFNESQGYALGRGNDGSVYKYDAFGGVWVSDGNGGTVQIGDESGYYNPE